MRPLALALVGLACGWALSLLPVPPRLGATTTTTTERSQ